MFWGIKVLYAGALYRTVPYVKKILHVIFNGSTLNINVLALYTKKYNRKFGIAIHGWKLGPKLKNSTRSNNSVFRTKLTLQKTKIGVKL